MSLHHEAVQFFFLHWLISGNFYGELFSFGKFHVLTIFEGFCLVVPLWKVLKFICSSVFSQIIIPENKLVFKEAWI